MPHSMQCPQCSRSVKIGDDSAGRRVRCPHCQHEFLVPGQVAAKSDDDDWLNLDDHAPTPPQSPPPHPTKQQQTLPAGNGPMPPGEDDDDPFASLPDAPPTESSTSAAMPVEYETEYRINCKVCGSLLYGKAEQAGKTIRCPDCHSDVVVPPPPKKKQQPTVRVEDAETFSFAETPLTQKPEDPFRKSATQLLDEAAQAEEDDPKPETYDTPKVAAWAATVFGVFVQPGVLIHWLVLSTLASIVCGVVIKSKMVILVLTLIPLGLIFAGIVIGCGFAILQAVANGEKQVTEWPVFSDPGDWLSTLGVAIAAAFLSGIPAMGLSQLVFGQSGLVVAFITMLSIYALYPFVLLSMLDMQSVFKPFSPDVAKSVTRCEESWGAYYFSTGLLFIALFLIYVVASLSGGPAGAVIVIFASVGATFLMFSMMGRLAYQIGQAVNGPPMENDIEELRQSERQSKAQ